jgi:serine/threonine protein kinase
MEGTNLPPHPILAASVAQAAPSAGEPRDTERLRIFNHGVDGDAFAQESAAGGGPSAQGGLSPAGGGAVPAAVTPHAGEPAQRASLPALSTLEQQVCVPLATQGLRLLQLITGERDTGEPLAGSVWLAELVDGGAVRASSGFPALMHQPWFCGHTVVVKVTRASAAAGVPLEAIVLEHLSRALPRGPGGEPLVPPCLGVGAVTERACGQLAGEDLAALILPLARFGNLTDMVCKLGRLSFFELAYVGAQLVPQLLALRGASLSHGDIKPCQVLVTGVALVPEADVQVDALTGRLHCRREAAVLLWPDPAAAAQPHLMAAACLDARARLQAALGGGPSGRYLVLLDVVLADFDRCVELHGSKLPSVGTKIYTAPEVSLRAFRPEGRQLPASCGSPSCHGNCAADHTAADVWALGITLAACLTGTSPVWHNDSNSKDPMVRRQVGRDVAKAMASLSCSTFFEQCRRAGRLAEQLPPACVQALERMLTVDPTRRATLDELAGTPWLQPWLPL